MTLPDLLGSRLDGEEAVAQVPLSGEDVLVVTPTRTLVYRAEGLLSDESVEELPHDAERLDVSEGRRKAKLTLDYGLDGDREISMPAKRLAEALHPVLAGVLNAAEITEPGETVLKTFRFSELTLVVTSQRVVKHIGAAVWDQDFEEFRYADVTDVDFEEGSVATSVVMTMGGRQERFKAPNSEARAVRESVVDAICAYHDVGSVEELRVTMADEADDAPEESFDRLDFGDGPDPLGADPAELKSQPANATRTAEEPAEPPAAAEAADAAAEPNSVDANGASSGSADAAESNSAGATAAVADPIDADSETTGDAEVEAVPEAEPLDAFEGSPFESAGPVDEDDVADRLAALSERVERQSQQLARQNELIERLVDELRRDR